MEEMKWVASYQKYSDLLKERGINTATVCNETNILESTIANWKTRDNSCSIDTAKKIADYLKVPVENLLEKRKT